MRDEILDKIFKLSRNQKEIIHDNFNEICHIIGIKSAQIEGEDFSNEFAENNDLNQKAQQYAQLFSNDKEFLKFLKILEKAENSVNSIDPNNEIDLEQAQDNEDVARENLIEYVLNNISIQDSQFYNELITSPDQEDFVLEIISIIKGPQEKSQQQETSVRQISYNEYIGIIASKINQELIRDFQNKKEEYRNNPALKNSYVQSTVSVANHILQISEATSSQSPQYQTASEQLNQRLSGDLNQKDLTIEELASKLGISDSSTISDTTPDEYIQEEISARAFIPTGEPYENNKGELIQVYGRAWAIPIKSTTDQNGKLIPVYNTIINEETGETENIPVPKIEIKVIEDLHNYFVAQGVEEGLDQQESEMISGIKNIYEKYFPQERYDGFKKKLLVSIYNKWRSESPLRIQEVGLDPSRDFRSFSKEEYTPFVLSITEEDVQEALSESEEINKFFEDMKYAKGVLRDISGYAARVTIASDAIVDSETYNFVLQFCEKYYGNKLERLSNEETYSLVDLLRLRNSGNTFGEFDSEIDQINERVVKKIMESGGEDGQPLSFEEALGVIGAIFDKDTITYLKNVKDRAEHFVVQQELSHGINFSHEGSSNFCMHCGRYRGRCIDSEKYTDTGVNRLKGTGKCLFIFPERDQDIVLSATDIQHMNPETIEKYFDQVGDKFVQKKCDFNRGSREGSCDLVKSVIFEDFSRPASINEVFNRDVPVEVDGVPISMRYREGTDIVETPVLLNDAENALVQNYTESLLFNYVDQINYYFKSKTISLFKNFEEQQNKFKKVDEISDAEIEEIVIDRDSVREALLDYLSSTSSYLSDSILSSNSRMGQSGDLAVENALRMQRSSKILFNALEAYNVARFGYDQQKAQFMAGTDLIQMFACGAFWTNRSMLKELGMSSGSDYDLPITEPEKKTIMRDPSGKPVKGQDGEKELTIQEFLSDLKGIPFGNVDLPTDDAAAFNFIFMNKSGGSGYDRKMNGILNFVDDSLQKAKAFEIYSKVESIMSDPRIPAEEKQNALIQAWENIKKDLGYKSVGVPAYANKPRKYVKDPKTGNMVRDPNYEQRLSNWVREHFVDGNTEISQEEMAFYAADPQEAAEAFISMMNEMYSTFDFDMPYKTTSYPTDTDIELFARSIKDYPQYASQPEGILIPSLKKKYAYTGGPQDTRKFARAGIARWMRENNITSDNSIRKQFGENVEYYKQLLEEYNDLDFFQKYYSLYKFREHVKKLQMQGVPGDSLANSALENLHQELKSNYQSSVKNASLREDIENIELLKQRIFKDMIQRSTIGQDGKTVSLEEMYEEMGIPRDFFGSTNDYLEKERTFGGSRADYLPFFAPKIATAEEDLKHFTKGSIATTLCPSGTGKGIDAEDVFPVMTGYTKAGQPVSKQEEFIMRHRAFTTLTEKMMKLSLIDKEMASEIYDYINELSSKGCFVLSFTPKMNQALGALSLSMMQNPKRSLNSERPATISRAMTMYANAYRGTLPDRYFGFPLGASQIDLRSESDPGSANEFTSNMSPIQIAFQSIPEWGMGGVSFVEGLNQVTQGGRIKSTNKKKLLEDIRRRNERSKKASKDEKWYKTAQNVESKTGNFSHVIISSKSDLINCIKNSQMRTDGDALVLPFVKVVPYERFGSIKRVLDFKKRNGYDAIILTDAEYELLNKMGLIPNV